MWKKPVALHCPFSAVQISLAIGSSLLGEPSLIVGAERFRIGYRAFDSRETKKTGPIKPEAIKRWE